MPQISVRGSSDRRTPPLDTSPSLPGPLRGGGFPQCAPVGRTSTSRVPGVTRNSGWRAVNADIVRTRPVPRSSEVSARTGVERPAETQPTSPRQS
ncbi:hypothetical protein GCM10009616_16810 [Microlunatus lacustris]